MSRRNRGESRTTLPTRVALICTPFPFLYPLLEGVIEGSRRFGPWFVEPIFNRPEDEFADYVLRHDFAGCILTFDSPANTRALRAGGLPTVLAGTPPVAECDAPAVVPDDFAIGVLAAQHLWECGYRRFAFAGVAAGWAADRYAGFADEVHRRDPRYPVQTNTRGNVGTDFPPAAEAGHLDNLQVFLRSLPEKTAVFAAHDALARPLADAALALGRNVPGDLAVVGVDNDALCCLTGTIPLSSVDPNQRRIGFLAALTLDGLLNGQTDPPRLRRVTPLQVVRRQSTSLFAHDDPDIAAALRFIHDRACSDITVNDVCQHVAMSRRNFEQRFRAAVGRSPAEEIRHLRIDRAKSLLTETDLTLQQITRRCGYRHLPALAAAFRRLTGTSPAAYRRDNGVRRPPAPSSPPAPPPPSPPPEGGE
ncbi:MAG: substrate-binding domain-containing protein [Tepidisphaerales bacterium]